MEIAHDYGWRLLPWDQVSGQYGGSAARTPLGGTRMIVSSHPGIHVGPGEGVPTQ